VADALQEMEFRLAYSECDPAGIVYYAAYYPWMERVHSEWCFRRGIRTDEMRDRWGVTTVARASGCEYLRPPRVFDPIHVAMRLDRLGRTSLTWRFDFTRTSDEVALCVGRFTLVVVDGDHGRPAPLPGELRELALSAGPPLSDDPAAAGSG
jgi:YbgC/YbaW family acyl-CoA thioester hydrolase